MRINYVGIVFYHFGKKASWLKFLHKKIIKSFSYFSTCFSREQEHVKGFVILDLVREVSLM